MSSNPYELEDSLAIQDESGRSVVRIVLGATFYVAPGTDRSKVFTCLSTLLMYLQDHVRWTKNLDTFKWEPADQASVTAYLKEASDRPLEAKVELGVRGGSESTAATDFTLASLLLANWEADPSYLKITVPITFFSDRRDSIQGLLRGVVECVEPLSGYCGLMFAEASDMPTMQEYERVVYAMAQRFVAVEVDRPYSHLAFVTKGIKSVNWITIVHETLLEDFPSVVSWLDQPKRSQISYERIGRCIVIQSGKRPEIGDRRNRLIPEAYVETAKALADVLISKHRSFHSGVGGGFSRESSEAWLRRLIDIEQNS